jgi:hypothetical protein
VKVFTHQGEAIDWPPGDISLAASLPLVTPVGFTRQGRSLHNQGKKKSSLKVCDSWGVNGFYTGRYRQRVVKCQRRPSVEHRGISFSVVEMSFPRGWKWTVGKSKTVTVGVCATRLDAVRQAQTFIDAVVDWAA